MRGAVTFDFHNTLAHSDAWFDLEVRHLVSAFLGWRGEQRGRPADPATMAAADAAYQRLRREIVAHGREVAAEAGVEQVLAELGEPVDPAEVRRGVRALMRAALADVAPVPGAVATVRAVAAAGVPLGIVSSAVYHPFLEWTLDRFGLRSSFAVVVTSASAGYYKSRPEIYWHAAALLGAAAARTVHVGDSYRFDVAGARRAGMRTVWLRRDPAAVDGDGGPPDLTVESLEGAAGSILGLVEPPPA